MSAKCQQEVGNRTTSWVKVKLSPSYTGVSKKLATLCCKENLDIITNMKKKMFYLTRPHKVFIYRIQREGAKAETEVCLQLVSMLFATEVPKAILYFIHIHQVYYEAHFPPLTWRKKRRYCRVIPGFFLTIQSKEMAAKPLEAIQVPQSLSSDVPCTRKRKKKKIILSFYFYFALILFDDVSTGWDMLSWMAISLHHMCLSQDSRVR